ncbi:flagellar basal body rod protein [Metabacillus iocasae]|uniref:Lia operon protein LiaI n=1 Tax=Priestia iocasae TaxID=2291674 RepID=A0ABS2QY08_9BACI|nr:flagellar basal body rod protein [Metabacillus iocasae]MBM7704138.1 lia operon protein LiaI [Metabacillus iocasae]
MKKFGLFILGAVAAIVLLTNLGPMIALAISLAILYFVFKEFVKADTTFKKVVWGGIGLLVVTASISNIPAVIGVIAAYILYVIYKKWNESEDVVIETKDPFMSFEKEWSQLNQKR